jgi:putative DNA primase/helicase
LIFQVVRFEPGRFVGQAKSFLQRRRIGNNGKVKWKWDLNGITGLPLYRLPKVEQAKKNGATLFFVEGEKDVHQAERFGLCATTNAMGAGKWRAEYTEQLSGAARVVVIPDNDATGTAQGKHVATELHQAGIPVTVVTLPSAKDLHEWAAKGGTCDDLLALVESAPEYVPTGVADTTIPDAKWSDPIPLPDGLPPVLEMQESMIPIALRGWIADIADRMQVPMDYTAATTIVELGALIGRRLGIYPKKHDNWLVVANLWGAVVGRPALLKTPAMLEAMKPLNLLVAEAIAAHEVAQKMYEVELEYFQAQKAARKANLVSAAKKGQPLSSVSHVQESTPPPLRRYLTQDPTVEKLGEILGQNPNGLLVFRDELTGWLRSLDKPGRESDRSFYLESWSGTVCNYTFDRIGRGTLIIPELCLSVFGSIQPGPLGEYVYATHQGGGGDDGLLQRLQVLVWPDPPQTWRNVDRWPNTAERDRAYEVFRRLDHFSPAKYDIKPAEDGDIPAIRFSPSAQAIFNDWRADLETSLRNGEIQYPALEAHLAKYRSLMPSLALIFHLVDSVSSDWRPMVREEPTTMAVAWCNYLESHARRLYASVLSPDIEAARAMLERITRGEVADEFAPRDVYRNHWAKLATPEEVSAALKVLDDFGWVRMRELRTGGRPTIQVLAHPALKKS